MIDSMCSEPKILSYDEINHSQIFLIQAYNPKKEITEYFSSISGKIVIVIYLGEYNLFEWVEEILCQSKNYFLNTGKLKNYYIFLSVHNYPNSLFNDYASYFSLIHEPLLYNYYTTHFEKIDFHKNLKFHFLSLNNRASTARQSLYYFFTKFSLIEKSHFSYHGELTRTGYISHDEITKEICFNGTPWYLKNLNYAELNNQIPIKFSDDNFYLNDWSIGQIKYYSESFCSLVFETYDSQMFPFFTEKTWKPIAFGHPFILYSNPYSLAQLKELGFKTFSAFWDETYDELYGNQRLEAIFHLILEISNWSLDKVNLIYNKILPIIEYNKQHFFEKFPQKYAEAKPNILHKINQLIEEKIYLI